MKLNLLKPSGSFGTSCLLFSLLLLGPALNATEPKSGASEWPFPVGAPQRPGAYWWCPGSAWTREDIDWNLAEFKRAGFGFVHIIPIYGARGAEAQYIPYLSPKWMEMLDYTVRQAQGMGLFVDMTTGSGWCFGGPDLPTEAIDARASYDAKTHTVKLSPGRKVKRAAPGSEGYMINPYSPRAMSAYLERFSKAFDAAKPALPRAQYHDSFEYAGDWCPELLDEFKARCGYDLQPYLADFFNDRKAKDQETLARVKRDYRTVLGELHRESMERWNQWAHARGMITRDESHGSPANLLDVYATSDIAETEMFGAPEFPIPGFRRDEKFVRDGDSDPRICMLAASAAHVAHAPGKQLVCSESCTWLREHWHASLAQVKLELDLFFLTGVNQMLFHGSCYSPKNAPWPGWFFYASTKMDWRNSFWRDVPYLTDYIGRCQSMLQAGEPANDILLYWPIDDLWTNPRGTAMLLTVHKHDWMAKQRFGDVANALMAKGYAFDFISDRLIQQLKATDGKLAAAGGNYRALVVPACKYMPEKTLQKLAELAAQGATVVFETAVPGDVPGLAQLEARRAQLAAARAALEKTKAIVAPEVTETLAKAGVPREKMADAGLRFIRRQTADAGWYFIANHTAKAFAGWLELAMPFKGATLFDPMTGRSGQLATRGTQVYLRMEPGETMMVRAEAKPASGAAWPYFQAGGEGVTLTGKWSVEFVEGGPELPGKYETANLTSWTSAPDAKAQAFAGAARYTLHFVMPPGQADEWLLDLGDVRESARVRLNGQDAGALVALPFRLRVGAWLKPGDNTLEVEVTNLSANRVRDLELRKVDWKIMNDANIVSVAYGKFEPDKWPLEESGLLGPVKLVPQKKVSPP